MTGPPLEAYPVGRGGLRGDRHGRQRRERRREFAGLDVAATESNHAWKGLSQTSQSMPAILGRRTGEAGDEGALAL